MQMYANLQPLNVCLTYQCIATQWYDGIVPVIEDWHARTILLQEYVAICTHISVLDCCGLFASGFTTPSLPQNKGYCTTRGTGLTVQV